MTLKEKLLNLNINKTANIISAVIVIFLIIFASISFFYLSPVDYKNDKEFEITIPENSGRREITNILYKENLIKSPFFFNLYLRTINQDLYAGTYKFSKNMSAEEIVHLLMKGNTLESETVSLTFIEGRNVSEYADLIEKEIGIPKDEFIKEINSDANIQILSDKYWFLTKEVLNEELYYKLEGYLFPDTYFVRKNATSLEIIETMLNNTLNKLEVYKDDIELSKLNVHEIITLASIIEQEGAQSDDRAGVARVFFNRLDEGMTLGSDVTTYYASRKTFKDDLLQSELDDCNPYNTRGSCVERLPIGPICNPSLASINAVLNPTDHEYFYFVADINKKTHFDKTYDEHRATVSRLKRDNLWFTY